VREPFELALRPRGDGEDGHLVQRGRARAVVAAGVAEALEMLADDRA